MKTKKSFVIISVLVLLIIGVGIVFVIRNNIDSGLNVIYTPGESISATPSTEGLEQQGQTEKQDAIGQIPSETSDIDVTKEPLASVTPSAAPNSPDETSTPVTPDIPPDNTSKPGTGGTFEAPIYELDTDEVSDWFTMNQDKVLQKMGSEYEIIKTGAELSYIGYYYPNYGLTFIFTSSGKSINYIECKDTVLLKGAHGGMNFSEIMSYLGETNINSRKPFDENDETTYFVIYDFDNVRYTFFSYGDEIGSKSFLTIGKVPPK